MPEADQQPTPPPPMVQTLNEMDSFHNTASQLPNVVTNELRASIESVDEAINIIIPELGATAARSTPEDLRKLAEQVDALQLTIAERTIAFREKSLRADELRATKVQLSADMENAKNNNEWFWKDLLQRREKVISCYRKMLECLNLSMRMQLKDREQSTWSLEFKYKSQVLVFEFNDITNDFKLLKMTPKLTILEQLQTLMESTPTDTRECLVKIVLCAWRNYCQQLEAIPQTSDSTP